MNNRYVAIFNTSHETLTAEDILTRHSIPVKPVLKPRGVSSDCGLALQFDNAYKERVSDICAENRLNLIGIFLYEENSHVSHRMGRFSIITKTPDETRRLGETIGSRISAGIVISLYGDLGTGKTLLSKGITAGLGADEKYVKSPSFTIMNYYKGRLDIFHIDLYRLDNPLHDMEDIGYREIFYNNNVVIIEWADKISAILPEDRIDIKIAFIQDEERNIEVIGTGEKGQDIVSNII